jgi:superfamily II DNA or RNA helicase
VGVGWLAKVCLEWYGENHGGFVAERLIFESIPGVTIEGTSNPLVLRLTSPDRKKLNEIKKLLTVRNKSAKWKVDKATEKLGYWEQFDIAKLDEKNAQKVLDKIAACKSDIDTFGPLVVQEFFEDHGDALGIPAGFWWLGKVKDSVHENTTIKPFFVPGLRDYQTECLTEMFKYKRATGVLATGLGKSKLIASLCYATVSAGRRACVVVPTDYLVGQMFDTISEYTDGVMAYGGLRKKLPLGAKVLVVTAASAAKFITDYHTIIIDESQHAPASTWVDLLTAAEEATHVYNLTATPFRTDGMDLAIHAFGGPVVYERDARWGIANGWLKPLKVFIASVDAKRVDGSPIILPDKMPATQAYSILTKNLKTLEYAKKVLKNALDKGRKVIVLFKSIEAGEAFKEVCKPDIVFDVASSKFKKPLDDFKEGKINVLVSNDRLLSEGVDIPSADCLISLVQNHGDVTTYQAVGRVLRKTPDNKAAIVIDITTNGYAQFDRAQTSRAKVYANITDDVSLVSL